MPEQQIGERHKQHKDHSDRGGAAPAAEKTVGFPKQRGKGGVGLRIPHGGAARYGGLAAVEGLAGVGDLNTTCNSPHSRNGSYGEAFAREGISVADYEERRGMVVEGAHSVDALLDLAQRKGVELPVMQSVKALLDGDITLSEVAEYLMTRTLKAE